LQNAVSFIGLFCKRDLEFYRSYSLKPVHSKRGVEDRTRRIFDNEAHCNTPLQHTATYCNTHLQGEVCCRPNETYFRQWKTLQRTAATHCNTPQYALAARGVLQIKLEVFSLMQHTATHRCNTLQHAQAAKYVLQIKYVCYRSVSLFWPIKTRLNKSNTSLAVKFGCISFINLCMYMCVHRYSNRSVYLYICIHKYTYKYIYKYIYAYLYIYVYIYTHVYIHIHSYIYIYIFIYVRIYK